MSPRPELRAVWTQLIGHQDPYFVLELSGDKVTTKVVKSGGVDPVWDESEVRRHDNAL